MPTAEITNPNGVDTPSEFVQFPDYFTTSMTRDSIRERYPNKIWPEEKVPEVPASGWFNEFSDAFGDSYDQTIYDMGIGSAILRSDDDEAFSLLEEEYQNWKASPDDVKDYDILSGGFVGEVFGSITPSVAGGIGAGIGASVVATPVAGIWTGGSVMAALQGTTAKGGSMRNTYIALRNKMDAEGDVNFEKAYETARRVSNTDAVLAVGEAAVSTMVPVARVVPGIGKSIASRAAQKGMAELSFDAAVGATGSVLSDSYAEAEGIDRGDKFENAFRAGLQEMIGGGIPSVIRTYSEYRNLKGGKALYDELNTDPERKGLPYTPPAGLLGGPTTTRVDPSDPSDTGMVPPSRKPADGFDWGRENLDEDWDFLDAPEGRPRTPDELQAEKLRQATVGGDFTERMAEEASRTTARGTAFEAEGFEAGRQSKIEEESIKPGKKAVLVPVIDEATGELVSVRKATRAEVEDMVKRGANPVIGFGNDVFGEGNSIFQKNKGPIMMRARGGQWFEINADGTIDNLSPVEFDPFLSPDGLVLPLNEATDPDITSKDSRVTWKEAMVAFAEEIGNLQETFSLGTARVNILDDEFLKQEGAVPSFARILKRELSENLKLRKLLLPDEVTGDLSAEGLEAIQNMEVPSDLDAMVKNRLTAQGANTEDRTKQRYFLTANGGKVAVQGNKFGTKTVGKGLAQKSLLTQIGSVERADKLDRVIGERLDELAVAKTRQNEAGLDGLDKRDIREAEQKIKTWEDQVTAKAQINKKGETVPLGPKAIERKQEQIARQKELIADVRDKASADLPDQKLNPLLKSEHAILIEFLSDLNDPRVGPYPWENDPTGKTVEVEGEKYLLELDGMEGEEALLKLLQAKVTAVNFEVKSHDLEALTQESEVTSGEDLLAKGMVQEGGLEVSIEVDDAIVEGSPVAAVSIKPKPLNRKLPVLDLKHFEALARVNVKRGANTEGEFKAALKQETFRLAFAADIEVVARRIQKIRELQFLKLNLEPMLNEGRKGTKIVVDPALKDLTNIETFEQLEERLKQLKDKAKLHKAWKEGRPDGIHHKMSFGVQRFKANDLRQIESKASDAFGYQKGKFWKVRDGGTTFEDPNSPEGRFYASRIKFREFLDALKHLLPKMDGVLYMNMPFNVGAVPQIFKALVKLAIAFSADTGKGFVDFAKAIRQKPDNEAVKVAWEDAKTGRVRTTESYSAKVIKDIIKLLKNRSEERAAHKQAVATDGYVKATWDRFIDRFHLQAYREDGLKAPVQALIKRYMVNQYIDLADIMARIARGGKGKPLNKAEVEDLIRKLPDTENAWYLLDGLETLTSERGMEMDKFQEELFKNMLDNKVDPVKFTRYLIAKHAFERNKQIAAKNKKTGEFQDVESDPYVDKDGKSQGGGSGMGNSTARKLIAEARAEGKQELYEKLNQTYVKPILRNTLDMARDGGLIDEANHTKLTTFYKDYVPLRGLEDSDEIMRTTGNGVDVRGQEDIQKRAMGRRSEATEVIPYVFQQWSNMLMRTERVRVMQALANFIQANPNEDITIANPDYIRKLKQTKGYGEQVTWIQNPEWIKDTDLVGFKVGGKQHYMRFKNKELAHSLRNQGVSGLNSFLRVMGMGTRFLSRVNTQYNIGFTIPNFVRDIGLARMTLKSQDKEAMAKELANIRNIPGQFHHKLFRKKKGAVYDALAAAFRADYLSKRNPKDARNKALSAFFTSGDTKLDAEWDATYKEMKKFGGRIQFRGVLDMESRMDDLDALSKKITKLSSKVGKEGRDNFVKDWAVNVKELLEDINTAVESSTRLAVYKLARDRGATPQSAAYLSRNSTINFTRRGKAGAGLNSLFMFYNASAQGGYQVLSNINHTKKGKQLAYQIAATGFAVEMFNQMFSGEDEEGVSLYDKIPEWKKNTNLIIMSPFTGGKAFSFPLPYGYNAIHYTGQKIFKVGKAAYLGSADVPGAQGAGAAAGDLASTFSSAFNPIGGSTNLARMITPDIADVIIDINANKDWKGADIYPEPSPFAPYPGPNSSRYWTTVNPGLEYIARKMNEITGGDEVSSGWADVSPEHLEHVFGHIFGGAGSTAMRFEKMLHGMAEGKAPKLNDIPIARRFIAAPSSFYELEKFKQLRALSEQASDMHKLYLENGEYEDAKEYRKVNDVLFKIHPRVKNASSQIRKIHKTMRVVSASEGLSPQDKAIRLRRLKLQKNNLMGKTHSEFVDLLLPME
jgi:hypothetical protein